MELKYFISHLTAELFLTINFSKDIFHYKLFNLPVVNNPYLEVSLGVYSRNRRIPIASIRIKNTARRLLSPQTINDNSNCLVTVGEHDIAHCTTENSLQMQGETWPVVS